MKSCRGNLFFCGVELNTMYGLDMSRDAKATTILVNNRQLTMQKHKRLGRIADTA